MNNPKLAIRKLLEICEAAKEAHSLTEQAALYAAARHLLADLEQFATENLPAYGKRHEELIRARNGISSMLGFDATGPSDERNFSDARQALLAVQEHLPDR
ncbi:hypothetical protein [Chromobacterium subtsugae]|uniref:hypothetical protein n=1 Tax=Chromobacterium subtsugae TaxID=251747 RepID=UPI00128E427D|nr:hypothetical protein [Chromobacterium subtsugae]